MRVLWSPTARRRALAAVEFIAADRPIAAAEWFAGLEARLDLLRDFPEQGRVVREFENESIREVIYSPYRIIYEVLEDRIEILTLSHERQLLRDPDEG